MKNIDLENQINIMSQTLDDVQVLSKTGSWDWNIATNQISWSKNMFRILGFEPNELDPTYELALNSVHESDKELYEETLTKAIQNKTEYYFENRILRKDNLVVPVISRGRCFLDENNNIVRMIGTVQDISIQKKLEEANREKDRIKESDNLKSLILEIIAHDIRTPFITLNGFSELLIRDIQNQDFKNALKFAQIINSSTNQALRMLDSLLEWALTDTKRMSFNPEKITLNILAESIIRHFSNLPNAKNITINNVIKSDISITADKNMLITIIRNLISNAIKFCNNFGEITIASSKGVNETLISISDTGIGIEPEIIDKLFKTNELISTSGTDNEKGHGLGLQICKSLVEKHNGRIWIESEVGNGTTCNFTISEI